MVEISETLGIDPAAGQPERRLALSYVAAGQRTGVAALFALDQTLARLALGTRDPLVAQLRLTWWHEALSAPGAAPGQPILRALDAAGADRAALADMVDGWERLLDTPGDDDLLAFANARARLFAAAARLLGAGDRVDEAGRGWALADLACFTADQALAGRAATLAAPLLNAAAEKRWSRAGRPLGALVHIARADLTQEARPAGHPVRVARLLWHKVTGR